MEESSVCLHSWPNEGQNGKALVTQVVHKISHKIYLSYHYNTCQLMVSDNFLVIWLMPKGKSFQSCFLQRKNLSLLLFFSTFTNLSFPKLPLWTTLQLAPGSVTSEGGELWPDVTLETIGRSVLAEILWKRWGSLRVRGTLKHLLKELLDRHASLFRVSRHMFNRLYG